MRHPQSERPQAHIISRSQPIWIAGLAGAAILLLLTPGLRADNAAEEPEPIFATAKTAVAKGRVDQSKALGFHDEKKAFGELPEQGALLIGFDCGVGKFADIETVYALRPLYLTAQGEVSGDDHGLFHDRRLMTGKKGVKSKVVRTVRIHARPGYAVGGITVRSGLNINGLSVTFMKISGRSLDPGRSYESAWVGDRTGGHEVSVDGDGDPVVGVHGSQDDVHIMSLGLIFMQPPSAPKPAAKPPVERAAGEKAADGPNVVPGGEEPPGGPDDPPDEEAAADPGQASAKEPAVSGAARTWIPVAIFTGVAAAIFLVLLVSLGRKKPVLVHNRTPVGPAYVRPALDEGIRASLALPNARNTPVRSQNTPLRSQNTPVAAWDDPASFQLPPAESREMIKAKQQASLTLFGIAAAQFVCGLALVSLVPDQLVGKGAAKQAIEVLAGVIIFVALVFGGLGFWARFQPLAAASVGLGIYVLLFLLDLQANPQFALQGLLVKVGITSALVRAVMVSLKARQAPVAWAGGQYSPGMARRPDLDEVLTALPADEEIRSAVPAPRPKPWGKDGNEGPRSM